MIRRKMFYGRLNGIGGDDRCGVFAITSLVEKGYTPYILLTTDEEIGGQGAKAFTEQYQFELKKELRYMIEIDRRGDKQAVFYNCGNKEFQDYVLSFGFTKFYGTFSDIGVLSPKYDIASVNLSAGYYNEHSLQEYVKVGHLLHTVNLIKLMLTDDKNNKFYDYQEEKVTYCYGYGTTKKDTKKDVKKEDKSKVTGIEVDDTIYLEMYDDWSKLTDTEWEKKYKYKKPPTAEEVWDW